ncbi:MAG: thiamine phosphate synthase [Rhodobacteraceae bacterium]|jgi:thiamine-phosphate pyrophosphorylase|nr:thiamine phosphate synthase [Paracoccaceae bacterium]
MADTEPPQTYLITPPEIDLKTFPDRLARVLDGAPIACVRLALATRDEDRLSRAADALREVAHARDVAIVIETHIALAERLGLDGVHLADGAKSIRYARKTLGNDAIVGAFCGTSRHDGLNAAEAGADYVAFGPVGETLLGDGSRAPLDLFEWWSEVIEVPVVAEGALTPELAATLATITDFLAPGEEIWREDDALAALKRLLPHI